MSVYTIISGSTRAGSASAAATAYLRTALHNAEPQSMVNVVDLAETVLPVWREEFWNDDAIDGTWAGVSAMLEKSDGLIFVVPEWNGMVPPSMMNLFLMASRGEMSHKPALIVSISSGSGGSHPISMLRAFGYKNNQVCYVPDHIIIRGGLATGLEAESEEAEYMRTRIEYSLDIFRVYTEGFKFIRRTAPIDLKAYPYGM
jgi:NAD(P)H-dependent FMN reductase